MSKLFLLGDSTCAIKEECARPETGWGECFSKYLSDSFELVNMAKNGRSTEMIIHEGIFFDCFNQVNQGDWVIIQFGHNETKPEIYRRTYSQSTYKLNLKWFINNFKKKGANIVLISSIARRRFEQGICVNTHEDYPEAMKEVAASEGVTFIEMSERTREFLNSIGEKESIKYFMNFGPGIYPNYPNGKEDNTHLRPEGANLIANMIYKACKEKNLEFVK